MQKFTLTALLAVVALLLATACDRARPVPLTRLPLATPTALPVATEQPRPQPTAPAPRSVSASLLTGDGHPVHGEPPFTATLHATYQQWPVGLHAPCHQLRWDFGDGQTRTIPCSIDPAAAPHHWRTTHTYERAGIYHATVSMILANGDAIEAEKSQSVLVAQAQIQSLREIFVRWLGWFFLLSGTGAALLYVTLRPTNHRPSRLTMVVLALFLITFVPPFSYLPDPLGMALRITGGYQDNLQLPFANRFLISGDPTTHLRPTLDALIGRTGLDPLHPQHPLQRYEFLKITTHRYHTAVHVRFHYDDDTSRTYAIPLRQPETFFGFYARSWRYDGLGRLRTAHHTLPPITTAAPLNGDSVPIQRLVQGPPAHGVAQEWFGATANPLARRMLWSPSGNAFAHTVPGELNPELWLTPMTDDATAGEPVRIATNVWSFAWTPGGDALIYSSTSQTLDRRIHIYRLDENGGEPQQRLSLPLPHFPGITGEGLWFVHEGALWLHPWTATPGVENAHRLTALPDQTPTRTMAHAVHPAPDGQRIAYACGAGLCLIDAGGANHTVAAADPRFMALTWRADGQRLAAVFWDYPGGSPIPATLRILDRQGNTLSEQPVAPEGIVNPPTWLPDGETLLLQTYPRDGRRIIRVHPASGLAVDLSPPRWDATFALHPTGDRLLLHNGRGDYWLMPYTP